MNQTYNKNALINQNMLSTEVLSSQHKTETTVHGLH
jgi:hypothetical protein